VGRGQRGDRRVERLGPARVHDRHPDALGADPLGHLKCRGGHGAEAEDQHVRGALAAEHVHAADPVDRRDVEAHLGLGEPYGARPVVDGKRLAQLLAQRLGVARHGDRHARHQLEDRQVPHTVVAGSVGAGHARTVEDEGDR
jgi:hypothetical protein